MQIITTQTDSTGRPTTGEVTVTVDGEQHTINFQKNGVAEVDESVGEAIVDRDDTGIDRYDESTVNAYEDAVPDGDDDDDTEATPPKLNAEEEVAGTDAADERRTLDADVPAREQTPRAEAAQSGAEARQAAETETVADPAADEEVERTGAASAVDAPFDPSEYNVGELQAQLDERDLSRDDLESLAAAERSSDDPRSTALDAIEGADAEIAADAETDDVDSADDQQDDTDNED